MFNIKTNVELANYRMEGQYKTNIPGYRGKNQQVPLIHHNILDFHYLLLIMRQSFDIQMAMHDDKEP